MDAILSIGKLIYINWETNMDLKEAIKKWLDDWSECIECNHMCRNTLLRITNEDELICDECNSTRL